MSDTPRLTKRLLNAMSAALTEKMAGECYPGETPKDFEDAQEWVQGELERRAKIAKKPGA